MIRHQARRKRNQNYSISVFVYISDTQSALSFHFVLSLLSEQKKSSFALSFHIINDIISVARKKGERQSSAIKKLFFWHFTKNSTTKQISVKAESMKRLNHPSSQPLTSCFLLISEGKYRFSWDFWLVFVLLQNTRYKLERERDGRG